MELSQQERRTLIECIGKQITELTKEYFDATFYDSKIKELKELRSKLQE